MLVALLSCTKDKKSKRCQACEMYSASKNFKAAYSYANKAADKVFILSSKYGLLECDDEIDPVNENMAKKPPYEKRLWATNVIDKLSRLCNPEKDEFLIIAQKEYFEYLAGEIRNCYFPLEGVPEDLVFKKLKKLEKNEIKAASCHNIHRLINNAREYSWDKIDEIPFSNGVYVIFEKDEHYGDFKRITRVGTHRGDGNLKSRLETHFLKEEKNWSIFRRNIGRALLNKDKDPYLKVWDLETGTPGAREQYADIIDEVKERAIEKRINLFLRHHVTFACIEIDSWFDRLRIEEGLIATLNLDSDFGPSSQWFGRYSPLYEIRNSGLWLKRGLDKQPIKRRDIEIIEKAIYKQKESIKTTELESAEAIIKTMIKDKKESAGRLNIRYIDLFADDLFDETGGRFLNSEIVRVMKKVMKDNDKIISNNSYTEDMITVRYFLQFD